MKQNLSLSNSHNYVKQHDGFVYVLNIEEIPDLVMVLSSDGTVQEANSLFNKMLQYSSEEITGKSYSELVHPDDVAQ